MTSFQRPGYRHMGLLALVLAAIVTLPAIARAADTIDTDQTLFDGCDKVLNIDGAIARVRFVDQKIFIGVKSGEVNFKIQDGDTLFIIPAGTSVMVGPVDGTPTIGSVRGHVTPLTALAVRGLLLDAQRRQLQLAAQLQRLSSINRFAGRLSNLYHYISRNVNLVRYNFVQKLGPYGTM